MINSDILQQNIKGGLVAQPWARLKFYQDIEIKHEYMQTLKCWVNNVSV